jgi:hypothetical protein
MYYPKALIIYVLLVSSLLWTCPVRMDGYITIDWYAYAVYIISSGILLFITKQKMRCACTNLQNLENTPLDYKIC